MRAVVVPKAPVLVTWMDAGMDSAGRVTVAWSNDAKSVWTAAQRTGRRWDVKRVAPVGSVFYGVTLVVNGAGNAAVGWESVRGGDHPVEGAYRMRAGSWAPVTVLSPRRGDSYGPDLLVEPDGDVTAGWVYDGPRKADTRVQSRHYSAR